MISITFHQVYVDFLNHLAMVKFIFSVESWNLCSLQVPESVLRIFSLVHIYLLANDHLTKEYLILAILFLSLLFCIWTYVWELWQHLTILIWNKCRPYPTWHLLSILTPLNDFHTVCGRWSCILGQCCELKPYPLATGQDGNKWLGWSGLYHFEPLNHVTLEWWIPLDWNFF